MLRRISCRNLHTTAPVYSHIGSKAVVYPSEVEIIHDLTPITNPRIESERNNTTLTVKGPLGLLSIPVKPFVKLSMSKSEGSSPLGGNRLSIDVEDPSIKVQRAMWGTTRATIQNMVTGVTDSYTTILRIVGVGYRATLDASSNSLSMKLGYAHNIDVQIPSGLNVKVPQPTRIIINGTDKQAVGAFAAKIRGYRKPEPYRGKGIFVDDETIKLKDGKGKKK